MKFCPECNNLLYPKEDRAKRELKYVCRNCGHEQLPHDPAEPVYANEIKHDEEDYQTSLVDVTADPTLPRTKVTSCERCGHNEAVFFQANRKQSDSQMTLFFVCCNPLCGHQWKDLK